MSIQTKILVFALITILVIAIVLAILLIREVKKNIELERQKKFVEMDRENWIRYAEETNVKYQDLKRERKAK